MLRLRRLRPVLTILWSDLLATLQALSLTSVSLKSLFSCSLSVTHTHTHTHTLTHIHTHSHTLTYTHTRTREINRSSIFSFLFFSFLFFSLLFFSFLFFSFLFFSFLLVNRADSQAAEAIQAIILETHKKHIDLVASIAVSSVQIPLSPHHGRLGCQVTHDDVVPEIDTVNTTCGDIDINSGNVGDVVVDGWQKHSTNTIGASEAAGANTLLSDPSGGGDGIEGTMYTGADNASTDTPSFPLCSPTAAHILMLLRKAQDVTGLIIRMGIQGDGKKKAIT